MFSLILKVPVCLENVLTQMHMQLAARNKY